MAGKAPSAVGKERPSGGKPDDYAQKDSAGAQAARARRTPPQADLTNEIEMLRRTIQRMFELAQELDVPMAIRVMESLGAAASRLAVLLRAQADLAEDETDELQSALSQAINELLQEKGLLE